MIDEPIERVEHLQLVHIGTGADGLCRAQTERAAEHRSSEKHSAFAVAEQVHAPRDRSLEGLYLLLAAEFVSFALIIVYAGAILITYLFVIMLASQSPTEDQDRGEAEYDTTAREP